MQDPTRRRLLGTVVGTVAVGLAGCSGDGGGGGSDGDGDDGGTDGGDDGSGDDGGDADLGPGGPVSFTLSVSSESREEDVAASLDAFETLELRLETVTLSRAEAESVTVTPETTIDLLSVQGNGFEEREAFVDGAAIPTGEYTEVELALPVETATLSDGSSVSFTNNDPLRLGLGETLEDGDSVELAVVLRPIQRSEGGDWEIVTTTGTYT